MVAFLCRDATGSAMTAPAGWTTIVEKNVATGNRFGAFYKVAGASEPASYDFDINDTNEATVGTIVTLTGQSTSAPIDTNADQTGNSESPRAASITPIANTLILTVYCVAESGAFTAPGLHTLIDNSQAGSGIAGAELAISYRENSATTATGEIISASPDDSWLGMQISIKP